MNSSPPPQKNLLSTSSTNLAAAAPTTAALTRWSTEAEVEGEAEEEVSEEVTGAAEVEVTVVGVITRMRLQTKAEVVLLTMAMEVVVRAEVGAKVKVRDGSMAKIGGGVKTKDTAKRTIAKRATAMVKRATSKMATVTVTARKDMVMTMARRAISTDKGVMAEVAIEVVVAIVVVAVVDSVVDATGVVGDGLRARSLSEGSQSRRRFKQRPRGRLRGNSSCKLRPWIGVRRS